MVAVVEFGVGVPVLVAPLFGVDSLHGVVVVGRVDSVGQVEDVSVSRQCWRTSADVGVLETVLVTGFGTRDTV